MVTITQVTNIQDIFFKIKGGWGSSRRMKDICLKNSTCYLEAGGPNFGVGAQLLRQWTTTNFTAERPIGGERFIAKREDLYHGISPMSHGLSPCKG